MTASLGLTVCNNGYKPTYSRVYAGGISRSHIDITFANDRSSHLVCDWKTLDEYSASLYRYITFSITGVPHTVRHLSDATWSWRKYDRPKLLQFIETVGLATDEETMSATDALNQYLKEA